MARACAPERWALLSPRLDELLELDPASRRERLAAWRAADATLADELQALLHDADSTAARRFLQGDALAGPAPQAHAAGQRCGAWTLVRALGAGGMGSVWLAERGDGRYEGRAAVKLPHPALLAHGGAGRFEREGRLLARLAHPHIAALLDAGVGAAGQPYLVLEYVQGQPITAWCDAQHAGVERRVALLLDVLAAVAHAHQQLVLHRDLKPANILVDAQARVKLLDFGIAKLIEPDAAAHGGATTQLAFTPDHAAPEQLQGEPAGTGTDVYALGVLLYQLLAGSHPTATAAQTPMERLRAVIENEAPPMSEAALRNGADSAALRASTPQRLARTLRGDLDTIVAKALKKNPAERYAGAAAFADDLRRWRDGVPVLARPDSAAYRLSRFVRRHRAGVAASSAALLLLLATVALTAWQARQARSERDEARWQAERAFARGNLFNLVLGRMGRLDEPLTQRRVLESALEMIEQHHAQQPKLAVELLLPIAGQFHSLGDVKADLAVMQRAASFAQASGSPELVAQVACSTVDTHIALGQPAMAAALVGGAEAAMAAMAEPPPWLRVSCVLGKAMAARALGQIDPALAAAEAALRLMEGGDGSARRGNMYPQVLSVLAALRRDVGDVAGAFAAAEQGVEVSRAAGGAASLDTRVRQRNLALLMIEAGEVMPALRLLEQALSAWPRDDAPPFMLLTLADAQLLLGDSAGAAASAERARAGAERIASIEFDNERHFVQARAARLQGRAADARQHLQQLASSPNLRRVAALPHTPGSESALLDLAEGRPQAALQSIAAELQRIEALGGRRSGQRADALIAAAQIALAAGEPARARDWAQAAADAATRSARQAEASAHVGTARLLHARSLQALGDAAGAAAAAARAVPALERGLGAQHALHAEALRLAQR
ncbi:MAG: serine/threonine-protein kinase [Rubrivivax sp.]